MTIDVNDPCLDLAAYESKDRLTGEKWNNGEFHGGLQCLLLGHHDNWGDHVRVINIDGSADMSGAIRFALRLDPHVSRVLVYSKGRNDRNVYDLRGGSWCVDE